MPIKFEHKTLKTTLEMDIDLSQAQEDRLLQLNGLDEYRKFSLHNTEWIQQKQKKWHDKSIHDKKIYVGD